MKRNIIIVVAAVLLIGIAIVTNASKQEVPTEAAPKVGYLAPNFKLQTMDGGTFEFDHANLDKPVLINFWASWCKPCASEAEHLVALHEKYTDKIDFIAVNLTIWEYYGAAKAKEFVETYKLKMPIPLEEDGTTIKKYNIIGIPITVLVDKNGVIDHIVHGEFNPEELDKLLARL